MRRALALGVVLALPCALPAAAAPPESDCTIVGTGGDDVLVGGPGRDVLCGLGGDDILMAGPGNDVLRGGPGNDLLLGRRGRDLLEGGSGHDVLVGGPGRDRLFGGGGVDSCYRGERTGRSVSCEARALGEGAGLTAFLPARRPLGVLFHESLFRSAAPMRPAGRVQRNDNPGKFHPPPATDGPPYGVMGSRGRAAGATTAADVVVRAGTPIRAPVSGTVVVVRPYRLYCSHADVQVYIRPDAFPDLRVGIFHLREVPVRKGDRVVASVSKLGYARELPGAAQEDAYVPGPYPHVHVEIERGRATPVPGCL